jgi:hypothetical protein
LVLLVGDWLAIGLFVLLGQMDHGMFSAAGLPRLLQTTVVLAAPWTVVAALLGAYQVEPDARNKWRFLGRSLTAWLVAAPLALLLRAWLQGQAAIIVAFFVVTLMLGGAFVLLWRGLFGWRVGGVEIGGLESGD